ncbi:hypothetical protein GQR58_028368 [Nymphon striatum]|nr:hypothetical protein GQR58_028368 [Nymphon striatum]
MFNLVIHIFLTSRSGLQKSAYLKIINILISSLILRTRETCSRQKNFSIIIFLIYYKFTVYLAQKKKQKQNGCYFTMRERIFDSYYYYDQSSMFLLFNMTLHRNNLVFPIDFILHTINPMYVHQSIWYHCEGYKLSYNLV